MKKFWKGGSVILGEYENDEGQFGTDSNIFKPITARIMKSKHDGFFHEDGKSKIRSFNDLEIGQTVLRKWPYNGALYNCKIRLCSLESNSNNQKLEQISSIQKLKISDDHENDIKTGPELIEQNEENVKKIQALEEKLADRDKELIDTKMSLDQIKITKNNLESKCSKLESELTILKEQCAILAAQRNQYEAILDLDENFNRKGDQGPNDNTKYKLLQKMKKLEVKMKTEVNFKSGDFDLVAEKIRLASLVIDGIKLKPNEKRPLVDNIEKRRFMEQLELVKRLERDRSQLSLIKLYDTQTDSVANASATRQKIAEIKNAAKTQKSRSDRYEYSSPKLPRLSKYLTPKKRKQDQIIDGESGIASKINRRESDESSTDTRSIDSQLPRLVRCPADVGGQRCPDSVAEDETEEDAYEVQLEANMEILDQETDPKKRKQALVGLDTIVSNIKNVELLEKVVSACIKFCDVNSNSDTPALEKLKNKAINVALKSMLSNNLFNTLLSNPAGILIIMTLCMKLIRTENYRSMGFSLMVAVQDEMQTWDTDELEKLESVIEKRPSLDLDLSLGLGIFLSTIGPINDFFVKSQFKQIKLNSSLNFEKTDFITCACLTSILLWETESERREKAICILQKTNPKFSDTANLKSFDLMSAAATSLPTSKTTFNLPEKILTLDDIGLTISTFYQKIAVSYFL